MALTPVVFFFFSIPTVHFQYTNTLVPIIKKYSAGDFVSLPMSQTVKGISLQGQRLLPFQSQSWIGAIPFSPHNKVSFAFLGNSKRGFWPTIEWAWTTLEVSTSIRALEHIELPEKVQRLLAQADVDSEKIKALRLEKTYQLTDGILKGCWKKPINSRVTSHFATPRTLPNNDRYYHMGVDLRAATGTLVHAPQNGRIVFVEEMSLTGKTVVIYHGSGIHTKLAHLNQILVKEHEEVQKDQVIGISGNTGRSTAPHLHWEVSWKGTPLNPLELLQHLALTCDLT